MKALGRRIAIAEPALGDEEWEALREPLRTGWVTQGPQVAAFEAAFAQRHGVANAVAVSSCTAGLQLALLSLGVGSGHEVLLPAFTWVATANVVVHCGATPVLVDVDPRTFTIDPAAAAERVTDRTAAAIPVHLFGLAADMDALRAALPPHVRLLEDAACAAGGAYRGRPAGALGDAAAFSFHPRKSITTGEGGMVTTDDDALAACVDRLRNHGASVPEEVRHRGPRPWELPDFDAVGFNLRMSDLQGAVGLVQLGKLDAFVAERQRWAAFYRRELADLEWLRTPDDAPPGGQHAWQAYVCAVDPATAPLGRDDLMARLDELGVATRPGTHAVHLLGYYRRRFGFRPADYPVARACAANTIALPLHNRMTADDFAYVVEALHACGSPGGGN
jgi:dTDP-4-amino-4,6-dideoxygalactose transaminase